MLTAKKKSTAPIQIVYHSHMYPPSSRYEKVLATGILLTLFGLSGLGFVHPNGTFKLISGLSLVIGFLLSNCAFFVHVWDKSTIIRRIHRSPDSPLWLGITVVFLWLVVLPFAILWVYHQLPSH
jgi:hypothetical protein